MHRVGVDAQGRGGCIGSEWIQTVRGMQTVGWVAHGRRWMLVSGWMHRVVVDAESGWKDRVRVRCIGSEWDAQGRGGMHRVGVGYVRSGWDAHGRGGMHRVGVGCIGSGWKVLVRGGMHMVRVDAEGRGGMHKVGVDAHGRGGCTCSG